MTQAIMKQETTQVPSKFTQEQIETLKNLFFRGLTDDDFKVFLYTCERTGLDPFVRQIYPVKRKDKKLGKEVMTIQTSIDGYRLIADRTGRYCPGREPTFQYDKNGHLFSATSYLKKQTNDGTWHEVSASAMFSEYSQGFVDFNTGVKKLTSFWADMPHNQLAKCAESLCIRKAFPADLSGVYTKEEMAQSEESPENLPVADCEQVVEKVIEHMKPIEFASDAELQQLRDIIKGCDPKKHDTMNVYLDKKLIEGKIKKECFKKTLVLLEDRRAEYVAEKMTSIMEGEEYVGNE